MRELVRQHRLKQTGLSARQDEVPVAFVDEHARTGRIWAWGIVRGNVPVVLLFGLEDEDCMESETAGVRKARQCAMDRAARALGKFEHACSRPLIERAH